MSNMQSRPARNGRNMQRRPGGSNGGSNNGRRPSNGGSNNGRRPGGGSEMNVSHATAARDRYLEKAREAISFGDRVMAENFFQHADHYNRIVISAEERRHSDESYHNKRETQEQPQAGESAYNASEAAVIIEQAEMTFASTSLPNGEQKPGELAI